MNLRETLRFAVLGLLANRVQSLLTMLGVLIGVAAVILLVAVGQGSAVAVEESIEALGSNTISVLGEGSEFGPVTGGAGGDGESTNTGTDIREQDLTLEDVRALNDPAAAPDVKSASPVVTASAACRVGVSSHSTSVTGTWPAYFEASNSPLQSGAYLSNDDVERGAPVAVIGTTVRDALFGADVDPVGQEMTCDGVRLTVIGLLAPKGSLAFQDADDTVVAPLSTVQQNLSGYGSLNSITVQAADGGNVDSAQSQTSAVLADQHGLEDGEAGSWQVLNSETIASALTESSDVFTVLLGAVAGISLLVGDIGITNIMFVTVTERTREIGIRKAIPSGRARFCDVAPQVTSVPLGRTPMSTP